MAKRDELRRLIEAAAVPSDSRTYNGIKRRALELTTERNFTARLEQARRRRKTGVAAKG